MLTIEIINDGTGDEKHGNYDYRVLVNGQEIDRGRVTEHYRPAGWQRLVLALAQQAEYRKVGNDFAAMYEAAERAGGAKDEV
jgi:hypothetical protein